MSRKMHNEHNQHMLANDIF